MIVWPADMLDLLRVARGVCQAVILLQITLVATLVLDLQIGTHPAVRDASPTL
jgi:hypothetical protein